MAKASRRDKWFNPAVALPPGFGAASVIGRAIEYMERELGDLTEIYFEQANVFSALVGIYGTKALDSLSNWEKNPHSYTAQQRFPDLCRRGRSRRPKPSESLESKASKRPWAIQSHYNHADWYIIWRYLVDPTKSVERAKPVIIWRVDVVFLKKSDWKYEKSKARKGRGGRTHTFGVSNPARKLQGEAIYQRTDVVIRDGKPVVANGRR
ncbi:MAG: hypothetical protein ACRD3A_07180 [Terriglobales bacterium]